jgi:hypothetical protein
MGSEWDATIGVAAATAVLGLERVRAAWRAWLRE